jgi:(S)-sulfolactate dehydrogenase
MSEIVISEFMSEAAIATALTGFDVAYDPSLVDRPDELAAMLGDCRGLIVRNRTQVNAALLDLAPHLKVVGRLGVGLDNIDLEACTARKIAVFPATGANDLSVAEYVITAALVLLRGAWFASTDVAAGSWPRMALIGSEAEGRRLGLIGFGAISRLTAKKARALGLGVCAFDPYVAADDPAWAGVERTNFDDLLATSDIISLHVPLTADTRGVIGAKAIARMKKGAILINAARGGVVDEAAVAEALKAGRLGGAALDVFAEEPVTAPGGTLFNGVPNLILTPHIAGVTKQSNERVSLVTAQAVARALRS